MAKQHSFSAYDKYLCLKFSIPMWLATLFLVRPFAVLIMSIANKRNRTGLLNTFYSDYVALSIDTAAALPALLVLFALARRQPDASAFVRKIWHHGRSLLLVATTLNIASVFLPFIWRFDFRLEVTELVKLSICIVILFLLIRSDRVKDTFNDFPAADAETPKKRTKSIYRQQPHDEK